MMAGAPDKATAKRDHCDITEVHIVREEFTAADLIARRDTHQGTLIALGNTLQTAEGDLERFVYFDEIDPRAGHELLSTLRGVAERLAELIEDVEADVTAAEKDVGE